MTVNGLNWGGRSAIDMGMGRLDIPMSERVDPDGNAARDAPGRPKAGGPVTDGGVATGEHAAGVDQRAPTVLHVDDEPGMGPLVADFLDRADGEVSVVTETDPVAALERVAAGGVDCLVTDVQMPGMDGRELVAAVADVTPELPVVLFTSCEWAALEDGDLAADVAAYVGKGDSEQLRTLAETVVAAVD